MKHFALRSLAVALLTILLTAAPGAALPTVEPKADLPPGDSPPATLISRVEAAGDAEDHTGFDHLIVLDESVNRVDERGVTRVLSTVVYKVLTEKGCRDLSVLRFNYDPQSLEVEIREVALVRDGELITIEAPEVRDLPAPQWAIYWRDRIKVLQLPRLQVGDGIVVKTFRRGFTYALLEGGQAGAGSGAAADDDRFIPPMPGEYFEIVLFAADVPIVEKRYQLHLPAGGRLHSKVYNGTLYSSTSYSSDSSIYEWWGFDLQATPNEPRQPAASDFATKVVLATVESWEAKSRWFFDVNDGQFDTTPEIDTKVAEVLDEAGVAGGSDADKAEALVHWVAQNIRYSGQTMGKGEGFTLHPATMIYEQRSGVCKDIAGMLVAMMRAAEIPTYPAMTMAGSRIEEVPADQFNHCVVARQDGDEWVMYDPTWVPYNNDIWSKLETEQHYLVGSPDGEPLSRIAYSPPAESPLTARHSARLEADGTLSGTIRISGGGASDGRLRRIVYGSPARRLQARMERLMAPVGEGVEVSRVAHHRVDDFSSDMWIEVDYRAPKMAMVVDGGLELSSPLMSVLVGDGYLFAAGSRDWAEKRGTDLFLMYTQRVDAEESISLPAGLVLDAPSEAEKIDETYAAFSATAEVSGGVLLTRVEAEVRRRQIPPDGYKGFRRATGAARDWAEAVLRLAGEGSTR